MLYKQDWDRAKAAYEAFWAGSCLNRCAIQAVARRADRPYRKRTDADLYQRWTDTDYILDETEAYFQATYFAAEALPSYYPFIGSGSIAAFLGSGLTFKEDTVWFSEVIGEWEDFELRFDGQNKWWLKVQELTRAALERGRDKYLVGITDFHGAGDNLLLLRGSEKLCMDFVCCPEEVKRAVRFLVDVTEQCYDTLSGMILRQQDGTTAWMGIWGRGRHDVLQEDIGALVSPGMFREYFLEEFERYVGWLDAPIFHIDGPEMIRHLDMLLEIPGLNAFQWVPGDGKAQAIGWIPMLKRIQEKGKSLFVYSTAKNVEGLLRELSPEGLFIHVLDAFEDQESADRFVQKAEKWSCRRP